MSHSGVSFVNVIMQKHDSIVYFFTKCTGCGWDTKQEFHSGKSECRIVRIVSCVKPQQYLLVEGPSELAIYEAVINGVCFTTVNTITIIFDFNSV